MSDANNEDWDYLSGVLESANADEDLIDGPVPIKPQSKLPKTNLEAQIQDLILPNAPLTTISGMRAGKVHIHGVFSQVSSHYLRRGMHITETIITDNTSSARVIWFNQPYKTQSIRRNTIYELRGTYALYRSRFQINNAKIRPLSEGCAPFERGKSK